MKTLKDIEREFDLRWGKSESLGVKILDRDDVKKFIRSAIESYREAVSVEERFDSDGFFVKSDNAFNQLLAVIEKKDREFLGKGRGVEKIGKNGCAL